MAGFLDPSERVVDIVLTDVGKQLLMGGGLRFVWWRAFDDEVDYDSPCTPRDDQTISQRRQELTESPLVREATMGYRGASLAANDTTNLNRPMFSGPSGMGQTMALPQLVVSQASGALAGVSVSQQKLSKVYVQKDSTGKNILQRVGPVPAGYQRSNLAGSTVEASYSTGSYPSGFQPEGFLVRVFVSGALQADALGQVRGGFQEVVHNNDSGGDLVYRNDVKVRIS